MKIYKYSPVFNTFVEANTFIIWKKLFRVIIILLLLYIFFRIFEINKTSKVNRQIISTYENLLDSLKYQFVSTKLYLIEKDNITLKRDILKVRNEILKLKYIIEEEKEQVINITKYYNRNDKMLKVKGFLEIIIYFFGGLTISIIYTFISKSIINLFK